MTVFQNYHLLNGFQTGGIPTLDYNHEVFNKKTEDAQVNYEARGGWVRCH